MNRSLLIMTGLVSILEGAAFPAPKLKESETGLKPWQGTWVYESQTLGGIALTADQRDEIWVIVEGELLTKTGVAGSVHRYKIKLDSTTSPKSIDLVSHEHPSGMTFTQIGIYEWNGETLRVCLDNSGKVRPKEFRSPKGQDNIYVSVLKRKVK